MELVYLWVEDYKNIKNQGFNFSPRFECGYDKDSNKLTIEPKEYTSIFPSNINVTAIVGENGSGKSSLLEYIENNHNNFNIIKKNEICNKEKSYVNHSNDNDKINILKYTLNIKIENNTIFYDNFRKILNQDNQYFDYLNKDFFFNSYYIYTNFKIRENNKEYDIIDKQSFIKFIKNDIKKYLQNKYQPLTMGSLTIDDYPVEKKLLDVIDTLNNELYQNDFNKICNKILKLAKDNNLEVDKNIILSDSDIDNFLDFFKYDKNLKAFKSDNMIFSEDIKDIKILKYLRQRHYIKEEFIHNKLTQYSYQGLSSGEKHYLNLFTYIVHQVQNSTINTILLDEPDIFLHPQWQKEFIKYLLLTMRKLGLQNIHIIFTTHSPFLLSDLPKENIIFLEKGKQVYPDIETFGANIHTLLSHGFFMKDGLMGEFAKGKIEYIRKFYNKVILHKDNPKYKTKYQCLYKKKQKDFEHIQKIIGEPFLKTIVKNQLEEIELILLGKKEAIDNEIARLQVLKESFKDD